ncbi:MAG: hypothetical protein ABF297_12355 [Thiogranum sp.]
MGASPVSVTICMLALGSGMLLFSTGSEAIPGRAAPQSASSEPTADRPVAKQPAEAEERAAIDQTDSTVNSSALTSELEISPPAPTDLQESGPQPGIPCLHGFLNELPLDDSNAESPCVAPAVGQQRLSIQFGSRIGARSSMLGELDGIRVDYRLTGGLTVNGVAGYQVLSSKDKFNATRQMFGINAVTGKFARAWDLNSYLIEQQDNGKLSSRSVGGAVRYLRPRRSMLLFLDYDVFGNSLGSFMTSGAWKLPYRTTLSATLDIRKSPIRKQQRKYLQQTMASSDGWYWILPDNRIKHFTKNRANEVATLALGLSHSFSQRIKFSGDVAMMDVSNSAISSVSTAAATRLSEYFYHLKLSGTDMMIAGDKNILDFRHRISDSSRLSSASIDTKYAINRYWNISPRLRADYRNNTPENSVQWVTSPSLKMEYRWRKQYGLDIQAGGEWLAREDPEGYETRSSYFMCLGYKAKF